MFIRNFSLDKIAVLFICIFISFVVGYVLSVTDYASYYEYYPYKLLLVLLFCGFLIRYYYGVKASLPLKLQDDAEMKQEPRCITVWLVVGSAILVYCSIAILLYTAWMKDDEFMFAYKRSSYFGHVYATFERYTLFVSRIGDLFVHLCPLGSNRWQVFLLTPLVPTLIPFALHRLVSSKKETIFSFFGFCFYWLCVVLSLVCVYLPIWRSYYCYAANANYLWPSALLIWFLSYYNKSRWNYLKNNLCGEFWLCCLLFVLGLVVAWSQECLAVVLLPLLSIWFFYHLRSKKYIPASCFWGYIGVVFGAFLLFAAPALKSRLAIESPRRKIDIANMPEWELEQFLSTLNWEKVNLLMGPTNVVNFQDIPLLDRAYFLPFLLERYWECCVVAIIAFLSLIVVFVLLKGVRKKQVKIPQMPLFYAVCSVFSALAYSVSCIPGRWSFTVCGFLLVIACAFVVQEIRKDYAAKWIMPIVAICLILYAIWVFVPAAVESIELKKYEHARIAEIIRQRDSGKMDVELQYPLPYQPVDSLGLIQVDYMTENPKSYNNGVASQYFKVKTISQKNQTLTRK